MATVNMFKSLVILRENESKNVLKILETHKETVFWDV